MDNELYTVLSSEYFYIENDLEFMREKAVETDKFQILFVEKGTARLQIGQDEYVADSSRIFALRPRLPVRLLRSSGTFKAVVLGFPAAMLHEGTRRMVPNFFMYLYTRIVWKHIGRQYREQMEYFKGLFRFAVVGCVTFNRELVQALVTGFVFGFYEMAGTAREENLAYTDSSRSRELFERFIHLLNDSYRSQHEVQFYAGKLCISAKYLTQITKRMIARTPKQIIDERLVHEATNLLGKYNYSIQEISSKLGFVDQSYFGRFFKRMMHMSPQQYRVSPKG